MQNLSTKGPHSPRCPSKLRISSEPCISTPFSPSPSIHRTRFRTPNIQIAIAPQTPPAWTWTCHQCHSSFPLGATRRCLHDGHRFCAGATLDRRSGRVKRHKACGSTFDYVGWKTYNSWRDEAEKWVLMAERSPNPKASGLKLFGARNNSAPVPVLESSDEDKENASPVSPKNCERQCSFPSECRWNPKPKKEKKKKSVKPVEAIVWSTDSSTDLTPATTIEQDTVDNKQESLNTRKKSVTDFRAPVLDFAAFKARLDRASSRRTSGGDTTRPKLAKLQLGLDVLMDVDAISPTGSLPDNKGIQVAITSDDESSSSSDAGMRDAWESDSDSDTSPTESEVTYDTTDFKGGLGKLS